MSKFDNSKKQLFVDRFPEASIESENDLITERCKFNLSYFCVQEAGQDFDGWNKEQLVELLQKFKNYTKSSLNYWKNQTTNGGGNVFEVYGRFPSNTDFIHPKHVPIEAEWARFRLEGRVRLIGFVVPDCYHGKSHSKTKLIFDCNTFYVVFLDADHRFYKLNRQ